MQKLQGYKTVIVFSAVILNGILNQFGWGLELPPDLQEYTEIILGVVALFMRFITKTPVGA